MTMVNVGDILAGKYRVDRVLGIGGMGMVVAATHLELEQRVALKFMLPEAMLSAQAADRFLREARAAVKLRGEHVCRVLDVGKLETGSPYIVMEFLEGEDFAHLLARRGVLPVHEVVDLVLQALEGLAEAHAAGIVHRDLKPGNLYIATDSDGSPLIKVLDFGISKTVGGNTKTGDVMGSPAYMAPEQMVSAKDVDWRADIWAMGVILYHAVSGRLPFEQENLPQLCMSVMNDTPAHVGMLVPVPPGFGDAVMRCLAKQREGRFGDVGELATALAPFGSPDATASASRVAKVLRRTGVLSGSSAAIAVTQPGSWSNLPAQPTPVPAPTPIPNTPISTIGASAGQSIAPQPAPGKKSRAGVFAALGGVAVVAIVVAVVSTRGGTEAEPAKAPPDPATQPAIKVEPTPEPTPATKPETKAETTPDPTAAPEVKPETKPEPPAVAQTKPEIKKPAIAKPAIKTTKPAGSGSATAQAGSAAPAQGSAQTAVTPPAGSGSARGYQGIKGTITTEYPPTRPKSGSGSGP